MRRSLLCLIPLLVAGCTRPPRYDVYVTGYTSGGAATTIPAGSTIAVVENPAATNPLLEEEIVAKARRVLAARGFGLASPATADYVVTLRYGADTSVEHTEETRYHPGQDAVVKDSTGKVVGTVSGSASLTWEPVSTTTELQWLTVTALDGRAWREAKGGKPAWIGETRTARTNLDLRAVLDYLMVPAASAIGRNQPRSRLTIGADDPAVRAIRTP